MEGWAAAAKTKEQGLGHPKQRILLIEQTIEP